MITGNGRFHKQKGAAMSGPAEKRAESTLDPPIACPQPHTTTHHGDVLVDDYFWLHDRSNPDVIAYLEAENAYTERMTEHTRALQGRLYAEMRARIKETACTAPTQHDDYFYYLCTQAGQQYPSFYRKHGSLDAPAELLLDQNRLAEGHAFCALGGVHVSPDHRLLAYAVDTTGASICTIYVKDLQTGALLPDQLPHAAAFTWAGDNHTLFYVGLDEADRPAKLFRHTLGADPSTDTLVYHEPDAAFDLDIDTTRSRAFLRMTLRAATTTEVWVLPADQPDGALSVIQPRQPGMEYAVEHHGDRFLILTNDQAPNFKLVEAPISTPSKAHWRELIPHRPDVLIDGVDAFAGHIVLYERAGGLRRIRIADPAGDDVHYVAFPEPLYAAHYLPFPEPLHSVWPEPNQEFHSTVLRFNYTSLVTPHSVVDYDMCMRTWTVTQQQAIPSGYDPRQYTSERVLATAPDGAGVPITLVYRTGLVRDGSNPLLLYGYGYGGRCVDPRFDANRLSLLDRGGIFAIAHVRGGADLGRAWYDQGRRLQKKNTFTDLIACAEHLIAAGYTSRRHLAFWGLSAGGLLGGAVVNMRPELFRVVILEVPYTHVIATPTDPSIPGEGNDDWQLGNPANEEEYRYMRSYSPYDNIAAQDYPEMLVIGGLNDPSVPFWQPATWTAKLRATKTDRNLLLLKTRMAAGHLGASGRYGYLEENAFKYAFLLEALGLADAPPL
jgi:oligopeptidase B